MTYGLEFMGKKWDSLNTHFSPAAKGNYPKSRKTRGVSYESIDKNAMQQWHYEWAKEALRVAKPGAMLMAFGGTRTSHRLACAIEDAGWELFDTICWLYGSGFPKSTNISKQIDKKLGKKPKVVGKREHPTLKDKSKVDRQESTQHHGNNTTSDEWDLTEPASDEAKLWDGYGTAMKPAYEPVICARKPKEGTFAQNALKWGVAGLNIDGSRVEYEEGGDLASNPSLRKSVKGGHGGHIIATEVDSREMIPHQKGRWPANLIHDGSEEVVGLFPVTKNGGQNVTSKKGHKTSYIGGEVIGDTNPTKYAGDQGSAARFFYCAKASKAERNKGCEGVVTWESVDLKSDLMELKELLKDISEGGMRKLNEYEWSIIWSGKNTMGKFQKDVTYTISMISKMIIELKTLSCSQNLSTKDSIQAVTEMIRSYGLNLVKSVENINLLKQNTISAEMGSLLGVVVVVLKMLLKIKEKGRQGNIHSTVKPLALMKYLCNLVVSPTKGIILDPFGGSGTTAVACEQLKIPYIIIEKELEYCEIIKCRVKAANDPVPIKKIKKAPKQTNTLFDWDELDTEIK